MDDELVRFRYKNTVIRFTRGSGGIETMQQDGSWLDTSAPEQLHALLGQDGVLALLSIVRQAMIMGRSEEEVTSLFLDGLREPDLRELGFSEIVLN